MKNKCNIKYIIDSNVLKNYIGIFNTLTEPMSQLKKQMTKISKSTKKITEELKNIKAMSDAIKNLSDMYPNERINIALDVVKQIMNINNGMISVRMIEPLNISREYLSILEKNKEIERISRGIYVSTKSFEDSYYSFQLKYKKAIFSHMNALYFYRMTEEFPYSYTVTVPQSYHVEIVNEKCNVFYVKDDIYELGLCEIETPSGNKVKTYDLERCICDIVRSKNRMDSEQVKKSIRQYIQRKDKDMNKLSEYSKKMGINEEVMEMVGMYYG